MIKLKFEGMQATDSVTVGPAEAFRVAANFLRQLPENRVIGQYVRHLWHVGAGRFARYDCLERCQVHFEDIEGSRSQSFGPFDQLHVADGTMYSDLRLFAKLIDETALWHSFELETYWPSLVITGC